MSAHMIPLAWIMKSFPWAFSFNSLISLRVNWYLVSFWFVVSFSLSEWYDLWICWCPIIELMKIMAESRSILVEEWASLRWLYMWQSQIFNSWSGGNCLLLLCVILLVSWSSLESSCFLWIFPSMTLFLSIRVTIMPLQKRVAILKMIELLTSLAMKISVFIDHWL